MRALVNGATSNVVLTFRVDSIAQEPNETFILTLRPLNPPTPREGLFFQNTIPVTVVDSDSKNCLCIDTSTILKHVSEGILELRRRSDASRMRTQSDVEHCKGRSILLRPEQT